MINPSLEGAFQGGQGLGLECLPKGSHWLTCSSLCVYVFFCQGLQSSPKNRGPGDDFYIPTLDVKWPSLAQSRITSLA